MLAIEKINLRLLFSICSFLLGLAYTQIAASEDTTMPADQQQTQTYGATDANAEGAVEGAVEGGDGSEVQYEGGDIPPPPECEGDDCPPPPEQTE